MTISNGWGFQWTANPATRKFFEFLNLLLTLPSRHALSNHILENKKNVVIISHDQKLKNSARVTLAFDSGSSDNWATNISSEREWMINIIPKIEKMIRDASNIEAKLLQ
ncbi:7387_t:CDS:2, partial [Gigaspora rosea]